ncbi:MAG TPA: hypothetical protein VH054_16760 [Polyangiaceae bacterium]|jgi:hypothetical protein|nr:hypothetical protein [Polyangiaceae bacterium]
MLKRLLFGLLFGLLVGGLLAAAVIKGVGMFAFTGSAGAVVLAYVFAAVTGVLVGLVAGKPIWASGGQIEAGLKAVVGAGVASAAMWAMRRWLGIDLNLHELGVTPAIPTAAGLLPVVTLPLIAAVLGAFYEADNTPAADDEKGAKSGKGKAPASKKEKVRVAKSDEEDDDGALLDVPAKKAKK